MNARGTNLTEQLEIAERAHKCFDLKKAGLSYRQIAKQLDCSIGTVHSDLARVLKQLSVQNLEIAKDYRELENAKLDDLERTVNAVLATNHVVVSQGGKIVTDEGVKLTDDGPILQAVNSKLRIMERRARLNNLDEASETPTVAVQINLAAAGQEALEYIEGKLNDMEDTRRALEDSPESD
jgi:hypothetical protein